jgi:glycosyltransferase A (GT-A) superfamily protein (DUF2064 family)
MQNYQNCLLVILSKYPRSGNVKTRLASSIGADTAAKIMEALLIDVYNVHVKQAYHLIICAPESDNEYKNEFLRIVPYAEIEFSSIPNLRGNPSQLYHIFKNKLVSYKKVIVIAADTPGVDISIVKAAFNKPRVQVISATVCSEILNFISTGTNEVKKKTGALDELPTTLL